MFSRLLGRRPNPNAAIVEALYATIVASARQPVFYSRWGVPDIALGRFEMISLHMMLALRRLRGEGAAADEIAQELVDAYFLEVDHSLRELGIGDVAVPKRMKKLARMFYGRAQTYGAALDAGDKAALSEALKRNIGPESDAVRPAELATYILAADALLFNQPTADIVAGEMHFPDANHGDFDARA